jgi:hypothetical protein
MEHETVELRFGKGIGSFLFDRILRGQHKKGQIEVIGPTPAVTRYSCMACSRAACVFGGCD